MVDTVWLLFKMITWSTGLMDANMQAPRDAWPVCNFGHISSSNARFQATKYITRGKNLRGCWRRRIYSHHYLLDRRAESKCGFMACSQVASYTQTLTPNKSYKRQWPPRVSSYPFSFLRQREWETAQNHENVTMLSGVEHAVNNRPLNASVTVTAAQKWVRAYARVSVCTSVIMSWRIGFFMLWNDFLMR